MNESQSSSETKFPARPEVSLSTFMGFAGLAIFALFAVYALEAYFGISLARGRLGKDEEPMPVWIPIGFVPCAILGAYIYYLRISQPMRVGVDVMATVTKVGSFAKAGMRDVSFSYEHNGKLHHQKKSVSIDEVDEIEPGHQFHIIVHPKNSGRYFMMKMQPSTET